MKNKVLIIVFIILVIILAILGIVKFRKIQIEKEEEKTSRDFILDEKNIPSTVNTHGENAGIYVGTSNDGNDTYMFISIKLNKNVSKEEQTKSLIEAIGTATGYRIDINSINIDGNSIKIDLAKTGSPFANEDAYEYTDEVKYFIATDYTVSKTILDSINKTLKNYFGNDTKVYLSGDSENIHIENSILTIDVDASKVYDEQ
ncbi:MAG: hypothetical protein IJ629_07070 [Clostridia bacterium]|nr:hypothetical protein [Clostridia bacterium]